MIGRGQDEGGIDDLYQTPDTGPTNVLGPLKMLQKHLEASMKPTVLFSPHRLGDEATANDILTGDPSQVESRRVESSPVLQVRRHLAKKTQNTFQKVPRSLAMIPDTLHSTSDEDSLKFLVPTQH